MKKKIEREKKKRTKKKMPCLPEIDSLINRNVNASKETTLNLDLNQDGFSLAQPDILTSCEQVNDPFAVFCNIPQPANADGLATMCNLAQQTDDPNSFFQKLVRGQKTNLDNMAVIWESARLDSSVAWIPIDDSSLHVVDDDNKSSYLGLNLFNVQSLSVTDDAQSLVAVRDGWVVESNKDGLIHPAVLETNEQTPTYLRGPNTANQSVITSPNGYVRCVLFSTSFFFYGNGTWLPDLTSSIQSQTVTNITYQAVKMWITTSNTLRIAVFYSYDSAVTTRRAWNVSIFEFFDSFSNDARAFTTPIVSIPSPVDEGPFYMGFLGIQANNDYLYWSTMPNLGSLEPRNMHIHVCNLHDTSHVFPSLIEIPSPEPFLTINPADPFYYNAMLSSGAIDPLNPTQIATLLFVLGNNMFQVKMSFTDLQSFQIIQRAVRPLYLAESLDHSRLMFALYGTLRVSCDLQLLIVPGQTFVLDDDNVRDAYVFALSPKLGTDVWIIRNSNLYRLHNSNPSPVVWGSSWQSDFPMYFAQEARVSDFGLPTLNKDVYVPAISSRWYMGTVTRAEDPNPGGATLLPYEVARSAHQTFRYAVTSVKTSVGNLKTFPFAIGQLQRANEYMLAQRAFGVRVENDSNVVIETGINSNWQSNTHDQVSVQEGDAIVSGIRTAPYSIVSNNGLYLLYVIPDRKRLRLVFNPFNSNRMTQWCASDANRMNQALQIQRDLCWNNLKIPASELFTDTRCACIGGPALFNIVVPETELAPHLMTGPLAEALPCFASSCKGGKNGFHETQTNVSKFVDLRCSNRILNIVRESTAIRKGDMTKNGGFSTAISAGINRGGCSNVNPCDPGSICINGRCIATCTTTEQCQQLYGLSQSTCVNKICTSVTPPASVKIGWWVYFAIACAVLLIVCILLFVALAVKRKNSS